MTADRSGSEDTMAIAPIETRYAGRRFRSRLEARWAVLFDHLEIRWQYEPQGFTIDGTNYLPDFYLPGLCVWAEVKGNENDLDRRLMQAAGHGLPGGLLILGDIPAPGAEDNDWSWLHLPSFERVTLGMSAAKGRLWWALDGASAAAEWTMPLASSEHVGGVSDAYAAALSARFEWGETPNPGISD